MRKTLVSALVLASNVLVAATPIDGFYSSAFGGYSMTPTFINHAQTFNQGGYDAGLNFGYKSYPMRYEGEVSYYDSGVNAYSINHRKQTGVRGYDQAVLGLANVYYDLPELIATLQPFIGAGVGFAWAQQNVSSSGPIQVNELNNTKSTFAYQATGGISYHFAENYSLYLAYRFIGTSSVTSFNQANAGVTYRFDGNSYK